MATHYSLRVREEDRPFEALPAHPGLRGPQSRASHPDLVRKVRADGNTLYPSCSKEVIAGLTDQDILQRANRTTFKHSKEKFQAQGRSDREKKIDLLKRREGRKTTKAVGRSAVRDQYPTLKDKKYDFIFHPVFQSTDCSTNVTSNSDGTDSLDNDSGPKIRTLKS
ncbi:hypothetical protein B0H14DRAFT_2648158 [Mycena olivaceomarginata]|nr:hypothetical protein B0H14DRAFT_2648158 [Mycena olivaceomarginata]